VEVPENNAAMQRRVYMKDLEDKARTKLGRKVKIHETGRKKTVELTFEDDEDLENLLKTIVGQDIFD
jgi:ribosome-binding factor A